MILSFRLIFCLFALVASVFSFDLQSDRLPVRYEKNFREYYPWMDRLLDFKTCPIPQLGWNPNLDPYALIMSPAEIHQIMTEYYVVRQKEWHKSYSHKGPMNQAMRVCLRHGPVLHFLKEPGGMAAILYPDGGAVYLAPYLQDFMIREKRLLQEMHQWRD